MLDDVLLQVNKPGRYIGQELNSANKDFNQSHVKIALCFPELYEIGMSNYGMRIIYGVLNNIHDVTCERVFHPGSDFESIMRNNALKIFSLESKRELTDFDIVGFSLAYELNYTNMLNILDLAGIPLLSSMRDDSFPLIIGGGSCCLNPEPIADFIDLFVIGESEEAIVQIVEVFKQEKQKKQGARPNKQDLLYALSQIEGVYVPCLYDVSYCSDGTIKSFMPKYQNLPRVIKKRSVKDIHRYVYSTSWMIPHIQIVHDRINLEIMRGCPNGCRFCQARVLYAPYRCASPSTIIDLAKRAYRLTGYEDIALSGLSVCDHYKIKIILADLIAAFQDDAVSISLPSIRPRANTKSVLSLITKIKKTGLTMAPEVATEKLRQVINKSFDSESFFSAVEHAYSLGYQRIKLYFMIGLPCENLDDLDGVVDFAQTVSRLKKKIDNKAAQVNVSVATFIPKPHTPFQWLCMNNPEDIVNKQNYLKKKVAEVLNKSSRGLSENKLKISFHDRHMSFIEGVLSRGDRRLSMVILDVWRQGARFEAWDDYFSIERWMAGFKQSSLDPNFYLTRQRTRAEIFPWDFIDTGISKQELRAELEKANISEGTTCGTK